MGNIIFDIFFIIEKVEYRYDSDNYYNISDFHIYYIFFFIFFVCGKCQNQSDNDIFTPFVGLDVGLDVVRDFWDRTAEVVVFATLNAYTTIMAMKMMKSMNGMDNSFPIIIYYI